MIIMPHPTGPTDPDTKALIAKMKKKKDKFYLNIARQLAKSKRSKVPINVTKIGKASVDNDIVVVPGKVLGSGEIKKPVTVYALSFSDGARKKIIASGGKCLPLDQLEKKARLII